MGEGSRKSTGPGVRVLRWILYLLCIPAGFWLFTTLLATFRQPEWDRLAAEVAKRFPDSPDNASARRLELLAADVDLDLSTYESHRVQLDESRTKAERQVRTDAYSYLEVQLSKSTGTIDPPPASVSNYFALRKREFDAIEEHLLREPTPEWEISTTNIDLHLPNLLRQIVLDRYLLIRALCESQQGFTAKSEQSREATWKLNEGLWKRPELISRYAAAAVERFELGTARKMESLPVWIERFSSHNYAGLVREAMEVERHYQMLHAKRKLQDETEPLYMKLLRSQPLLPFFQLCMADAGDRQQEQLESSLLQSPCESAALAPDGEPPALGRWNILRLEGVASLSHAWSRFARLTLDRELTEKILELQQQKARTGTWPSGLPSARSVCPDATWQYEVSPDGNITLQFSRKLQWRDASGLILPLEFHSGN